MHFMVDHIQDKIINNSVATDNTFLQELPTQFKHQKTAIRRYSKGCF